MYRNDMYDYLKEHAYISKNKKSNYQFELSEERAECIANKFNSLVIDLYQNQWLGRIQDLEQENQELKKQLEESINSYTEENALRHKMSLELNTIKTQQKEFIEWLEECVETYERTSGCEFEIPRLILSKYKEIIGGKE